MRLLSRLNAWFKHICSWKDPRASWEVVFCIALLCYYPSTAIRVGAGERGPRMLAMQAQRPTRAHGELPATDPTIRDTFQRSAHPPLHTGCIACLPPVDTPRPMCKPQVDCLRKPHAAGSACSWHLVHSMLETLIRRHSSLATV